MEFESIIYNIAIFAPGFLFAIVCHEWAHAYMALRFGDETALQQGRLTLNPIAHMDPIGTVVWPLICVFLGGFIFGYAKPVPVNPARFKQYRSGLFWVSFAGPLMNIILAIFSSFLLALWATQVPSNFFFYQPFLAMLQASIFINLILAVFNLIPFPPLDGSKMVTSFLNYERSRQFESLERFGLVFLLVLWFTGFFSVIFTPARFMAERLPVFFGQLML